MTGRSTLPSKNRLLEEGVSLVGRFCAINDIPLPMVNRHRPQDWRVGSCAYYRLGSINICVERCAGIGVAGPAWSFPGYVVDRTPYGVMAHELGHHVDVLCGNNVDRYRSEFSAGVRKESGEEKLTNYCPDDGEWFAEMFRLFVTNPDLLKLVRPTTYGVLRGASLKPLWEGDWRDRMTGAPARTIAACEKKIAEAKKLCSTS